jgi:hypothetical protein
LLATLLAAGASKLGKYDDWFGTAKQVAEVNQPGLYCVNHFVSSDTIAVNMNGKAAAGRTLLANA